MILLGVLAVHSLVVMSKIGSWKKPALLSERRRPLNIRQIESTPRIRQVGSRESKLQAASSFRKYAPVRDDQKRKDNSPIRLSDLSVSTAGVKAQPAPKAAPQETQRPGARPLVMAEKKTALTAISLKGKEISEFMKNSPASASSGTSGDPRASKLNATDILVNLEVPEGVEPDELNKYELMFYGFQRRTAINYVNAFFKNLDKFQRENPHLNFPMTDGKQIMTGRLTYDDKGNIKQIRMVRWSDERKLQDFFETVLKDMDVLQNPPQALWKKNGEFSIFFSFVVNG